LGCRKETKKKKTQIRQISTKTIELCSSAIKAGIHDMKLSYEEEILAKTLNKALAQSKKFTKKTRITRKYKRQCPRQRFHALLTRSIRSSFECHLNTKQRCLQIVFK